MKQNIKDYIFAVALCVIWYFIGNNIGKNTSYQKGYEAGFLFGIDTVDSILERHTKDSSKVGKLIMVTPRDTIQYIISKKLTQK